MAKTRCWRKTYLFIIWQNKLSFLFFQLTFVHRMFKKTNQVPLFTQKGFVPKGFQKPLKSGSTKLFVHHKCCFGNPKLWKNNLYPAMKTSREKFDCFWKKGKGIFSFWQEKTNNSKLDNKLFLFGKSLLALFPCVFCFLIFPNLRKREGPMKFIVVRRKTKRILRLNVCS